MKREILTDDFLRRYLVYGYNPTKVIIRDNTGRMIRMLSGNYIVTGLFVFIIYVKFVPLTADSVAGCGDRKGSWK